MAFGHGKQAVEELRLHEKEFHFEPAQRTGTDDEAGAARGDQAVAGLEFPRVAALQPVAHALGDARDRPAVGGRRPFTGRVQG